MRPVPSLRYTNLVGIGVFVAVLLANTGDARALSLLGTKDFSLSGGMGNEMSVNPNGDLVYISGGMGQAPGILRLDTSSPGSISTSTFAGGGSGGGVAVAPGTGAVGTTNGGGTFRLFNTTGTVIDTESISGCGGSLIAGGGRFGVSTQCSDSFYVYDQSTGSMLFSVVGRPGLGGVGSRVAFNPATGRFYENRTPRDGFGGSRPLVVSPTGPSSYSASDLIGVNGFMWDANGVTNRLYYQTDSGNLQVLDGTSHSVLDTVLGLTGALATDDAGNRFYVGSGNTIKGYSGATNTSIAGDTFTLDPGFNVGLVQVADGDDRLYALTSNGSTGRLYVLGLDSAAVPEPASLVLLASGLAGLGGIAWHRARRPPGSRDRLQREGGHRAGRASGGAPPGPVAAGQQAVRVPDRARRRRAVTTTHAATVTFESPVGGAWGCISRPGRPSMLRLVPVLALAAGLLVAAAPPAHALYSFQVEGFTGTYFAITNSAGDYDVNGPTQVCTPTGPGPCAAVVGPGPSFAYAFADLGAGQLIATADARDESGAHALSRFLINGNLTAAGTAILHINFGWDLTGPSVQTSGALAASGVGGFGGTSYSSPFGQEIVDTSLSIDVLANIAAYDNYLFQFDVTLEAFAAAHVTEHSIALAYASFWLELPEGATLTGATGIGGVPLSAPAGGGAAVPEPASLVLLASGLAGLGGIAWHRARRPERMG